MTGSHCCWPLPNHHALAIRGSYPVSRAVGIPVHVPDPSYYYILCDLCCDQMLNMGVNTLPSAALSLPCLEAIGEPLFCVLCRSPALAIAIAILVPVAAATWVINSVLLRKQGIKIRCCMVCRLFLALATPRRSCSVRSRCGSVTINCLQMRQELLVEGVKAFG